MEVGSGRWGGGEIGLILKRCRWEMMGGLLSVVVVGDDGDKMMGMLMDYKSVTDGGHSDEWACFAC